jgi:hypothetical protein
MGISSECRAPRRRVVERQAVAEDDPGLHALYLSARRLIEALEGAANDAALGRSVAAYVECAVAQSLSRGRIRDALELLVHEHACRADTGARPEPATGRGAAAQRRRATAHVLDAVLRLAFDCGPGSVPMLREAV